MQSKIIYIVLFMLSFNIFHDSFISIVEKSPCDEMAQYILDIDECNNCVEFNKIHNLLHFIAIVESYPHNYISDIVQENYTLLQNKYTPPLRETSFKPPIV